MSSEYCDWGDSHLSCPANFIPLAGEEAKFAALKKCAAAECTDGTGDACRVLEVSLSCRPGKVSKSEHLSGIKGSSGMDGASLISDKRLRALGFPLPYLPGILYEMWGSDRMSSDDIGELGGTNGVDGTLGTALENPLQDGLGVFEGRTSVDELPLLVEGRCSGAVGLLY